MCGRYGAYKHYTADELITLYKIVKIVGDLNPSYNIAPSQNAHVVITDNDNTRFLSPLKWGLVPSWVKDLKKMKAPHQCPS